VPVTAGRAVALDVPTLSARQGLRVTLLTDGLTAIWPRWDWDVAGVPSFEPPTPGSGLPPGAVALPALPPGTAPSRWQVPGDRREWSLGAADSLRVSVQVLPVGADRAATVLPITAPGDSVHLEALPWNGSPAWRATYQLDATAHPGERALAQVWWLAPVGDGLLVLCAKGSAAALAREQSAWDELVAAVRFE